MIRKIPVLPTILVGLAIAVMIGLGVWQLQRSTWKQGLVDRYAAAKGLPATAWPGVWPKPSELPLFRRVNGNCIRPVANRSSAGENRSGEIGYVHIVDCKTGPEGPGMSVEIGWSKDPNAKFQWSGGAVSGVLVPDRKAQMRLVADTPAAGLQPSRSPSVETVSSVTPAGHKGYAFTWFSFAAIALIIYVLALRRREAK